ncbi:exonuclease SbcCD subunit D [Ruminococcus gauvreauii]|uniref:Nuclease SbcCD subunit D n=1 Tax=Ruminococcus gauvreauii TaxID=438033 RepID=A0ABY5VKI1_9FIRM|nr:exonuclease SbcCD subunit D [Ruminococcus gauvreauii]UWP60709.1 exonuclease SbcCD subunit D [Ruminococcus gauvreauii]
MRFFHLSDLHIGKQLHHYNLQEDQIHILRQIAEYARTERPDAVVIAGDIYDKAAPSGEAVAIFDSFLTELSRIRPQIPILIISGNHDSPKRLQFASSILRENQIYIAAAAPAAPQDRLTKVTLEDAYGEVCFYLLPFVKPGYVRRALGEESADSYDAVVRKLIGRENIDLEKRNVLVSHQFYTAGSHVPELSDSETVHVGGMDNVDIQALAGFDYAALGHIHGAQKVKEPWVRYCGTLLKYSVSEWKQEKALLEVTLKGKGEEPEFRKLPLSPLYDVTRRKGTLAELLEKERCEDYVSVTLTDEGELYQPRELLERVYPRILEVKAENSRTRSLLEETEGVSWEQDPGAAFAVFFRQMQGREMTEEEKRIMSSMLDRAKEEAI